MEKSTPHTRLSVVQSLIERGRVRATASAFHGARDLGIDDLEGMCDVVRSLSRANFFKSMTTHADHRIWQGVYHGQIADGVKVYLKLTVIDDLLIISFKEL